MERLTNTGKLITRERVRNIGLAATLVFAAGLDLAACSTPQSQTKTEAKPAAAQPAETHLLTQSEVFLTAAKELGVKPSANEQTRWKDGYAFDPNTSLSIQTEEEATSLAESRLVNNLTTMLDSENPEYSDAAKNIINGSDTDKVILEIGSDPEMKLVTTGQVDEEGQIYFNIALSYEELIDGSSSLTLADSLTFANISMEIIENYFKALPNDLSIAEKRARVNAFQNTPQAYQAELYGRLSKSFITQTGLLGRDYSIDPMTTNEIARIFVDTGMDMENKTWSDKLNDFLTATPSNQLIS